MDAARREQVRKHHAFRGMDDVADPIIAGPRLRRSELLALLDAADERDALLAAARAVLGALQRHGDGFWYARGSCEAVRDKKFDALQAAVETCGEGK